MMQLLLIIIQPINNLTQAKLAKTTDVYRSHIAGIESGSLNPSVKTIEKLAKALGVSVADLFSENI